MRNIISGLFAITCFGVVGSLLGYEIGFLTNTTQATTFPDEDVGVTPRIYLGSPTWELIQTKRTEIPSEPGWRSLDWTLYFQNVQTTTCIETGFIQSAPTRLENKAITSGKEPPDFWGIIETAGIAELRIFGDFGWGAMSYPISKPAPTPCPATTPDK